MTPLSRIRHERLIVRLSKVRLVFRTPGPFRGREARLATGLRYRTLAECARCAYATRVCAGLDHDHGPKGELDCIIETIRVATVRIKRFGRQHRPLDWYKENVCESLRHRHSTAKTFECFLLWGGTLRELDGARQLRETFDSLAKR